MSPLPPPPPVGPDVLEAVRRARARAIHVTCTTASLSAGIGLVIGVLLIHWILAHPRPIDPNELTGGDGMMFLLLLGLAVFVLPFLAGYVTAIARLVGARPMVALTVGLIPSLTIAIAVAVRWSSTVATPG